MTQEQTQQVFFLVAFAILAAPAAYDFLCTLVLPDKWSNWWFARRQTPLRLILWGTLESLVVIAYVGWFYDAIAAALLFLGLVAADTGMVIYWLMNRKKPVEESQQAQP